jgi:uncharacterized membrane protein YeaQ/YmgE (transglycosylase-associated protein family)
MEIGGFFSALLIGAVIGILGRLALPGRQRIPMWLTVLIGIAAAMIGTFIANALGFGETSGFDWREFLVQVAMAAGGVALAAGIMGSRDRRHPGGLAHR